MSYNFMQLMQNLKAFMTAPTFAEARRILEKHPELLDERIDAIIDDTIQYARRQGEERVARLFEERRALLRRCREIGIERAFAEVGNRLTSLLRVIEAFTTALTLTEARQILDAHPELLGDEVDSMLSELIKVVRAEGKAGAARLLEERHALLRRCRKVGIERAFAEAKKESTIDLAEIVRDFVTAPTPDDVRDILRAHPELLSDKAEALVTELIRFAQISGQEYLVRRFEKRLALLRRCRKVGVDRALAEMKDEIWRL